MPNLTSTQPTKELKGVWKSVAGDGGDFSGWGISSGGIFMMEKVPVIDRECGGMPAKSFIEELADPDFAPLLERKRAEHAGHAARGSSFR